MQMNYADDIPVMVKGNLLHLAITISEKEPQALLFPAKMEYEGTDVLPHLKQLKNCTQ